MSIETVQKLSRTEKLRLMEVLWRQLSQLDDAFESPVWHAEELAKTEQRHADGKEQVLEWETAKRKLRRQFE